MQFFQPLKHNETNYTLNRFSFEQMNTPEWCQAGEDFSTIFAMLFTPGITPLLGYESEILTLITIHKRDTILCYCNVAPMKSR